MASFRKVVVRPSVSGEAYKSLYCTEENSLNWIRTGLGTLDFISLFAYIVVIPSDSSSSFSSWHWRAWDCY